MTQLGPHWAEAEEEMFRCTLRAQKKLSDTWNQNDSPCLKVSTEPQPNI